MVREMPIFKKKKKLCLDRAALYFGQFARDTKPQAITISVIWDTFLFRTALIVPEIKKKLQAIRTTIGRKRLYYHYLTQI